MIQVESRENEGNGFYSKRKGAGKIQVESRDWLEANRKEIDMYIFGSVWIMGLMNKRSIEM